MSGPAEDCPLVSIARPSSRRDSAVARPEADPSRRRGRRASFVGVYVAVICARTRVETRRGNPSSVATPQARVREWTGSVGAVVERAAELSGGFQRRRGDASGGGARAEAEPKPPVAAPVRLGMSAAAPAGVATEKRPAAPAPAAAPEETQKRRRVAGRLVAYDDEGHRPKPAPRPVAQKAGDAAGVQGRARRLRGRVQARLC